MSHFSVLVLMDKPNIEFLPRALEKIMEPYDENIEVAPYAALTADEVHRTINERAIPYYLENDPEMLERSVPEIWRDWDGRALDEDRNALSTYNPNSKWDWYVVGGRWRAALILKEKGKGIANGEMDTLQMVMEKIGLSEKKDPDEVYQDGALADIALVSDVDWDRMDEGAKTWAAEVWDACFPTDPEQKPNPPWGIIPDELLETFKTREKYIEKACYAPYAVIDTLGRWHAKGKMGWWGLSSETEREACQFDRNFRQAFIDSAPPGTVVVMLDCHI